MHFGFLLNSSASLTACFRCFGIAFMSLRSKSQPIRIWECINTNNVQGQLCGILFQLQREMNRINVINRRTTNFAGKLLICFLRNINCTFRDMIIEQTIGTIRAQRWIFSNCYRQRSYVNFQRKIKRSSNALQGIQCLAVGSQNCMSGCGITVALSWNVYVDRAVACSWNGHRKTSSNTESYFSKWCSIPNTRRNFSNDQKVEEFKIRTERNSLN